MNKTGIYRALTKLIPIVVIVINGISLAKYMRLDSWYLWQNWVSVFLVVISAGVLSNRRVFRILFFWASSIFLVLSTGFLVVSLVLRGGSLRTTLVLGAMVLFWGASMIIFNPKRA